MVLRILKSNQPLNFIIFPLLGLIVWLWSFIHPENYSYYLGENENILYHPINFLLKDVPFLQVLVSFVLLLFIAFIIQQTNSRYSFIRVRTMLPAPLFVLIVGGFTEIHTLHPVYFAVVFLLIAIYRLFSMFDKTKPYSAAFDVGLLLGIGSLFYLNLILLFPAFFIGIAILSRDFRWRELAISIIGVFLPIGLALGISVLREQFLEMLKIFEQNIFTPNNHFKSNVPLHIFLGFLIVLTFLASIRLIQKYDTKKVSTRKYYTVFFLIFLFSLFAFMFVPATSHEILIITAVPVIFLVSNYLVYMKSRFWGELIFTLLLGIIVYMQIISF